MSELDRRVAIEAMGEEEPPLRALWLGETSEGGNWVYRSWLTGWEPLEFSTSLEHALRALDEHFSDADEVKLHMDRVKNSQRTVYVAYASETRGGRTRIHSPAGIGVELAEAICHHLLALKEEE